MSQPAASEWSDAERAPATRLPRFAETAVSRARLTLVGPRRGEAPLAPFLVLLAVLLVAGVAGLLTFNTSMQQSSFTATRLQDTSDTLSARQQSLQIDLDRLGSPEAVATRAQAMGMVPALAAGFLRLSDGRVIGDPQPASPDQAMRLKPLPAAKPKVLDPAPKVIRVPARGEDRSRASVTDSGSTTPSTRTTDGGQR